MINIEQLDCFMLSRSDMPIIVPVFIEDEYNTINIVLKDKATRRFAFDSVRDVLLGLEWTELERAQRRAVYSHEKADDFRIKMKLQSAEQHMCVDYCPKDWDVPDSDFSKLASYELQCLVDHAEGAPLKMADRQPTTLLMSAKEVHDLNRDTWKKRHKREVLPFLEV